MKMEETNYSVVLYCKHFYPLIFFNYISPHYKGPNIIKLNSSQNILLVMLLDQPKTTKKGDYDAGIESKSPPRILVVGLEYGVYAQNCHFTCGKWLLRAHLSV